MKEEEIFQTGLCVQGQPEIYKCHPVKFLWVKDPMKKESTDTYLECEQATVKALWIISPISLIKTLSSKS